MFCMGNPKHTEPHEIVPLYFDKDDEEYEPLTDDEIQSLRQEIQEENERIAKNNKT